MRRWEGYPGRGFNSERSAWSSYLRNVGSPGRMACTKGEEHERDWINDLARRLWNCLGFISVLWSLSVLVGTIESRASHSARSEDLVLAQERAVETMVGTLHDVDLVVAITNTHA
jgi:hypothetical protein